MSESQTNNLHKSVSGTAITYVLFNGSAMLPYCMILILTCVDDGCFGTVGVQYCSSMLTNEVLRVSHLG